MAEPAEDKVEEVTNQDEAGEEDPTQVESTATFEPVVQLEEVEVRSGEEDEEVLVQLRAKLYVYGESLLDKGTGNKQWNERGKGDVKILKHREHQKIRLLMRQEKTMKPIANHVIDPRIKLLPNSGSDKSWVWNAFDFADGELIEKTFAMKFGSTDNAQEFKAKFEQAQKDMQQLLSGADTSATTAESKAADEAAEAIDKLKVESS